MFVCFRLTIGVVTKYFKLKNRKNLLTTFLLQIRYFTTFLLLLHVQLVYLALSIFSQLLELTPQCFPETQLTRDIASVSGPLTRAGLGVFGCLVGALTIER